MSQAPIISDAFRVVVAATEAAIIADDSLDWGTLPKKVYFMHGHEKEIVSILQSMTNAPAPIKNEKYPLIILFEDIREKHRQSLNGITTSFKCRIVICTLTQPTLRADQRLEQNFKPVLLPIFDEFIRQLSLSVPFNRPTIKDMDITKWNRYYWGSQPVDKNILNDYIDAVEIESISLNLKTIC